MKRNIIKSFGSVDRLYHKGVNICIGCKFEHCGSCYYRCNENNFADCNKQAQTHAKAIQRVITIN